jgi:hypothetical protein
MTGWLVKSRHGVFASQSLSGHLVRGAAALALLYLAITRQHAQPAWAIVAALLALVLMRGCPVCWMLGLVETPAQQVKTRRRQRRLPTDA